MSPSSRFRDRRGIAAVEFAFTAPFLLLMLLGSTDLVIWLRSWLRLEQSAFEVAQVVTTYKNLYTSDFTGVFAPVAQVGVGATALSCPAGGIVVTGISNVSGSTSVAWQWSSGSCVTSAYAASAQPVLPGGYAPSSGASIILVEVATSQPAYVFSAGLMKTAGLSNIRSYAIMVPRNGSLPSYTSGTRPS